MERTPDAPHRVWPHRGLTGSVAPAEGRTGRPLGGGYRWDDSGDRRAAEAAAYVAELRRRLCPGPSCGMLKSKGCTEPCAQEAQPEADSGPGCAA